MKMKNHDFEKVLYLYQDQKILPVVCIQFIIQMCDNNYDAAENVWRFLKETKLLK